MGSGEWTAEAHGWAWAKRKSPAEAGLLCNEFTSGKRYSILRRMVSTIFLASPNSIMVLSR
jgi:hypothetical protein